MAINPSKLKTLVDQHSASPSAPPMPEGGYEDEDMDAGFEDEAEPAEPSARGEALLTEWGEFGKTLREEATELHDLAHDIGAELMLKEVPDKVLKEVGKSVDRMPDELSMGLSKYVSKLSPEDCEALCAALTKEIGEDKADSKLLYAYVQAAAKYAGEEIEPDEDFNEPEEDEEDEDEEDDETEDGGDDTADASAADAPPAPPTE